MKKLSFVLFLTVCVTATFAQSRDYKKGEFFAGYSNGQVDDSTGRFMSDRELGQTGAARFHGFNVAGVYNVSRYVGIKGDLSGTYNSGDFDFPAGPLGSVRITGDSSNSLYNVLGGVQFKDNSSDRRVKPFGHILVGAGHARTEVNLTCAPSATCSSFTTLLGGRGSETGFAGAFGGGLDIKLNDRFDLRAGQIDYNPVRLDSGTLHNIRISVGIVIK